MAQPDHRRPILATISVVCILGAGVWWLAAEQQSREARRLDAMYEAVDVSDELLAINDQMAGRRPRATNPPRNTDPGVPVLPIVMLLMTGVGSGLAAIAIRPSARAGVG